MKKILVIDDNDDLRLLLKNLLSKHGYEVLLAASGEKGIDLLKGQPVDLVLCDFKLHGMNGINVLKEIKAFNPSIPVVIITGYSNVRTATEVMRLGAIDYIIKPLVPEELLLSIRTMLQTPEAGTKTKSENIPDETVQAPAPVKEASIPSYIFSDSAEFKDLLKQVDLVAPTDMCVIIYGESGSGKEAFAHEIHKRSKRKDKPFHAIDCGALSKELAGSALFGHEKGAFTGALNQSIGSFEAAKGGTVFLDEIANLDYDIQLSLLRVMQERKIRRVGGIKDIPVDIRIIVASNKKLWETSGTNTFRKDLYHRFNEFTLNVTPLRERKQDIVFFANHFLIQANKLLNRNVKGFDSEVEEIFINYAWPGNLRELNNVVKRAALLSKGDTIDVTAIPFELVNFYKQLETARPNSK